jgi:hypothetical protein
MVLVALPLTPTMAHKTFPELSAVQPGLPICVPPTFPHPDHAVPLKEFTQRAASVATAAQLICPVAACAQELPALTAPPPRPPHPLQFVADQEPPLKLLTKSAEFVPRAEQLRVPKVPPSGVHV